MHAFEAYFAPESLEKALELMREHRGRIRPLAGGTDVLVRSKRRTLPENERVLLDLKRIAELKGISRADGSRGDGGVLRIGATVTAREIERDGVVRSEVPVLAEAACCMASPQIRAVATVGGNIANASPAADLAIPLLILKAEVEIVRLAGGGGSSRRKLGGKLEVERMVVEEFFKGPGETVLGDSALISAFFLPIPEKGMRFVFKKGGVRPAMECAVASVGCGVLIDASNVIERARVALGAVAPKPIRARKVEEFIEGQKLGEEAVEKAAELLEEETSPISDVRGSAGYRRALVRSLFKSALFECWGSL